MCRLPFEVTLGSSRSSLYYKNHNYEPYKLILLWTYHTLFYTPLFLL